MSSLCRLARVHVTTALRERVTLFWYLVFPLFLLVLLSLIFSSVGDADELTFPVAFANEETSGSALSFASYVEDVFVSLGQSGAGEDSALFDLRLPPDDAEVSAFVESQLNAVREGDIAAMIVLPAGFDNRVLAAAAGGDPATLTVYLSGGRTSSSLVGFIVEQVAAGIDKQILTVLGRFDPQQAFPVESRTVSQDDAKPFEYVDFLLPGILLMGVFTTGLFGVPGTILFGRDQGILRRYWVTPLSVPRYLAGFTAGHAALCFLQFACIWLVGRFALGSTISLFRPLPMVFLLLGALTFLAFGFLIAAVARTANAGMAIANILNMPMMFLGGLFFPIADLPLALRIVMYANPMTYLADGLRSTLSVDTALFPLPIALAVPIAWIVACCLIAARQLRWGVDQ